MQIKDVSKLGTLLRNERITNDDSERFINSGDVLEFGTAGISRYRSVIMLQSLSVLFVLLHLLIMCVLSYMYYAYALVT